VTNENREAFVKDYIFWLTDKSVRPQLKAFNKGFYTCLNRKAVSVLGSPKTLQEVVEGQRNVTVHSMRSMTEYIHCREDDGMIADFWTIVEGYDTAKLKRLLVFITGSDRLPAGSTQALAIQRHGGSETSALPASSTCFRKLFLADYRDRDVMARKLDVALAEGVGFHLA
jgi:hypothetical protein